MCTDGLCAFFSIGAVLAHKFCHSARALRLSEECRGRHLVPVTELGFHLYNSAVLCLYETLSDAGCVTTMITTMKENSRVLTLDSTLASQAQQGSVSPHCASATAIFRTVAIKLQCYDASRTKLCGLHMHRNRMPCPEADN